MPRPFSDFVLDYPGGVFLIILIIGDADKQDFPLIVLEDERIILIEYLLYCAFCTLIPLEFDHESRIAGIRKWNVYDICIAVTGRKLLKLQIVVTVCVIGKFYDTSQAFLSVIVQICHNI